MYRILQTFTAIIGFASTLAGCSSTSAFNEMTVNMRGMAVAPYPQGCSDTGGGILSASSEVIYGESTIKCRRETYVILTTSTGLSDKNNHPVWKVLDQVLIPTLKPNQTLMPWLICSSKLFPNDYTMAIGELVEQSDRTYQSANIVYAWRFNLKREKIEPIPVEGQDCSMDDPE